MARKTLDRGMISSGARPTAGCLRFGGSWEMSGTCSTPRVHTNARGRRASRLPQSAGASTLRRPSIWACCQPLIRFCADGRPPESGPKRRSRKLAQVGNGRSASDTGRRWGRRDCGKVNGAANGLGSSAEKCGLWERRPWRERFLAALALPSGVLGPVESRALRRLASICRWEGTVRLGSRVNPSGADAEGTEEASGSAGGRKMWGERGEWGEGRKWRLGSESALKVAVQRIRV
jgi:hypothetical protein